MQLDHCFIHDGLVMTPGAAASRLEVPEAAWTAARDTPLFDTEQYTRNLEAVYRTMYERHHSGLPPSCINEHLATSLH